MFGVQFITHHTDTITYLDSVRIALEGGCRWIQSVSYTHLTLPTT